jgi:phage shock protein PspC (stress-responsive transcriptional regulator)
MSQSDELGKLAALHESGALTDEEFTRAKARVLNGSAAQEAPAMQALKVLRRDPYDRWLGGVCGGIARITGMPSWTWRLFFSLLVLFGGTGILVYVLFWFFIPLAPVPVTDNVRQGAV